MSKNNKDPSCYAEVVPERDLISPIPFINDLGNLNTNPMIHKDLNQPINKIKE